MGHNAFEDTDRLEKIKPLQSDRGIYCGDELVNFDDFGFDATAAPAPAALIISGSAPSTCAPQPNDPINRPAHYTAGRKFEPIDVIRDWDLNFSLGNAVKYVSRAGRKDPAKTVEDLKKAIWYIQNEIDSIEKVK